jgi:hypothetical protein
MTLHFVESMDEVLRIALERELPTLPLEPAVAIPAQVSEEKLTQ